LIRSFGTTQIRGQPQILFSPDGRSIATAEADPGNFNAKKSDIVLWEASTGLERLHLFVNNIRFGPLAFSPDGRLLASTCETDSIVIWDPWTGKELTRLKGHRGWISSLAFAPDGKSLASAGQDTTVLIWDVSGLLPTAKLAKDKFTREELTKFWDDLAGVNGVRVYRLIGELSQRPDQTEAFLKDNLANNPGLSADRLARLLADLDDRDFKVRQKASDDLANLGHMAEPALKRTLDRQPSEEVKHRVANLLERLEGSPECSELWRLLRVVEVLERIGTPGARKILEKMANDSIDDDLVRESKASLARLTKATKTGP
jgi:hypothetical protein